MDLALLRLSVTRLRYDRAVAFSDCGHFAVFINCRDLGIGSRPCDGCCIVAADLKRQCFALVQVGAGLGDLEVSGHRRLR